MERDIDETLWKLFEKTGSPEYYMLYKAIKRKDH